jgi:hypothetical protein
MLSAQLYIRVYELILLRALEDRLDSFTVDGSAQDGQC